MVKRVIIVLWLAALLISGGGCVVGKNDPHVASDLTTPKAAALTFLRGISEGDVDTAQAACIGTEQQRASVGALSSLITGLRDYDRAITAKFGVEAIQTDVQLKQAISDLWEVSIQHTETAIVKEGPQTATVEPAVGNVRLQARPPIYLRKEKDHWKVDLGLTAQRDKRFSPDTAEQYAAAGKALHQAANSVRSGRYKTLAEAQRDADGALP